jgi:hypothetical protein
VVTLLCSPARHAATPDTLTAATWALLRVYSPPFTSCPHLNTAICSVAASGNGNERQQRTNVLRSTAAEAADSDQQRQRSAASSTGLATEPRWQVTPHQQTLRWQTTLHRVIGALRTQRTLRRSCLRVLRRGAATTTGSIHCCDTHCCWPACSRL